MEELSAKIAETTKQISGLLHVIENVAKRQGHGGRWDNLGSLNHIRETLLGVLIGFYCKPDGDEEDAAVEIAQAAMKAADWQISHGTTLYKTAQNKWVSIPVE